MSKAWRQLTDPAAAAPTNTPDRLTATSSVRARYWQEAFKIYADSKLVGAGAGAYEVARTRYRRGTQSIRHAHGYGVQTLADLGLIGLGLSLLAAVAWIAAALRATGLRRRDRGLPYDPERIGLLTMATVVVVFAVPLARSTGRGSCPATLAVALLCAGWVAGRGPLRARLEARRADAALAAPWRERLRGRRPQRARRRGRRWRSSRSPSRSAGRRCSRCGRRTPRTTPPTSLRSPSTRRPPRRRARAAERTTRSPSTRCSELAFIEDAQGDKRGRQRALEDAVRLQPANSETWRRLGRYR